MARMSTAPDLAKTDELKPLERAARHPLMLGPFIPDLEFFGAHVLPLMKQAGLRAG